MDSADEVSLRLQECGGTVAVGPAAGGAGRAAAFYRAVLGRQPSPRPNGSADLLVDGEPVTGIRCGTAPGRPHSQVHFAVTDADLTVRQAVELGGQVLDGPEETPYGQAARLADPRGGRFSVVEVD